MDDFQFDTMTRIISTLLSRRTLAGALGLSVLGLESADAKKKDKHKKKCKKKCGPCEKCKKGKCKPKRAGTPCGAGQQCFVDGACKACDVCLGDCDFTSLQDAVTAAGDGATIQLCPGRYPTNASIAKDVTVIGAGAGRGGTVLDGQGLNRVLIINQPGRVDMRDMRISGGFGPAAGIEFRGAALTLISVAIVGNTSEGPGGGIYIPGDGSVTLTDCEISENRAHFGGGIYTSGDNTVMLTGCEISGNRAEFSGGGITIGGDSTVTLTGCEISDNTAQQGGGIHNTGDATTLVESQVTGNDASSEGGGIYNNNGTVLVIDGSSVTGNTPDNCAGAPAC